MLKKVVTEVSLEWANRVKDDADPKDLKRAKVGPYDALYFETIVPLRDGATIRWRQWWIRDRGFRPSSFIPSAEPEQSVVQSCLWFLK